MRRHGSQAYEHPWLDQLDLGVEPAPACCDLGARRALVDAPLAPQAVLEMLDYVRLVGVRRIDARLLERSVEHPSTGPHERLAETVLAIARLLAHEHQRRGGRAFSEHRLRRASPERAGPARGRFEAESLELTFESGFAAAPRHAHRLPVPGNERT
jgi:hypothetical protein